MITPRTTSPLTYRPADTSSWYTKVPGFVPENPAQQMGSFVSFDADIVARNVAQSVTDVRGEPTSMGQIAAYVRGQRPD